METLERSLIVVGVNYRKTSLEIRNKFAFTSDLLKRVYAEKCKNRQTGFFILSTCNRTELYSTNTSPVFLKEIFSEYTTASHDDVEAFTFVKQGDEAIHHLFRVASGLDSQILGDYEIIGQLKNAFALAKAARCVDGYLEKLVNGALQASRKVRNNTTISDGTTSVSYAVIQQLKQQFENHQGAKVCLMGLGKFGELTLKNLLHYMPQHQLTVINRNEARAQEVSAKYSVAYRSISETDTVICNSDVLVVATGADHPIVTKSQIENTDVKVVFDLSVPSNVSAEVKQLPGVTFYDIDSLSEIVNETITKRSNQIPVALEIIDEHISEFKNWEARRALFTPVLN